MLLEKCWAKVYGSYMAIEKGSPKEGFMAISGAPYQIIKFGDSQNDKQLIQMKLEECREKGYVATVSVNSKTNHNNHNNNGINKEKNI